ncbi:LamG-like jellyroll fold domain-containing protein [Haloferula sp. A504]|uniref:LamG-like jellyroll fold domain-containing protein n=1 Tax=Haloferula sp. A504 TaxID=3373601 RepID=UPI0031C401A2|nr:FecR domain-containing protein [Verrucomicrobiaceae bacterium E54]
MNRGEQLIARLLAGPLEPGELVELRQCLEREPVLRQKLADQASLHGLLGVAMEKEAPREEWIDRCLEACAEADRESFEAGVHRKIRKVRFRRATRWAAAAVVMLAAGLLMWSRMPRPVATISNVVALGENETFEVGDGLLRGDSLRFGAGLLELDLAGRGRMIAEGPFELEFTGADSARLLRGRVVLRVTEKGQGYRLETPKGTVVDLGTEFGVSVDGKTGEVETHVLEGEVEALPSNSSERIHLGKNQALRQSGQLSVRIPIDQGSFYSSLPPQRGRDLGMAHWSFEPGNDGVIPGLSQGLGEEGADLELRSGTRLVDGPFGTAIHFDGEGGHGESSYRGIGGNRPRTVALWVRVPRDFDLQQGFAMISWGEFDEEDPGRVWQVSANPLERDGLVGRLRVGAHGGMAIGTTDLRDDQWHHVAVVLYPAADPSFGQHVLLFIDGSLEPISRRVLGVIDTQVQEASHGVLLGKDVTSNAHGVRFFRGAVDEVYIFDAALSQDEIRVLMERNEPPR